MTFDLPTDRRTLLRLFAIALAAGFVPTPALSQEGTDEGAPPPTPYPQPSVDARFPAEIAPVIFVLPPEHQFLLDGIEITPPDETYGGADTRIDLGGREVVLRSVGLAHSPGDQVIGVPDAGVLFVGDLIEERIYPIVPFFPPLIGPEDIDLPTWRAALAKDHRETEKMLSASGLQRVILRNGWYVENHMLYVNQALKNGASVGKAGSVPAYDTNCLSRDLAIRRDARRFGDDPCRYRCRCCVGCAP